MFRMWPMSTDVRMRFLPFANVFIIGLTILAYVAIGPAEQIEDHPFILVPGSIGGLLGHIWMHANFWHLAGNMLFLWIFGNAVCSRIGNFWYPLVYVGLGIMAGMGEIFYSPVPSIGASGAINGVIGVFAALFPTSRIKLLYAAAGVQGGMAKAPSMMMIMMWFVFDVIGAIQGNRGVGYGAHIGGFVAGLVLGAMMLRAKWVQAYKGERTLPEVLRLGWPTEDDKITLPEHLGLLPETPPGEMPLPPAPPLASGSAEAERTYEPMLDGTAAMPSVTGTGRSRFKPWRPTADAIRIRCSCGANHVLPRSMAGRTIKCGRCGAEHRLPG